MVEHIKYAGYISNSNAPDVPIRVLLRCVLVAACAPTLIA